MSYVIHHPELDTDKVVPEHTLGTYATSGWVLAGRVDNDAEATATPRAKQPARSASAAEWRTYAVVAGMDYDTAMAASRDQLADMYNAAPPTPQPAIPAKTPKES